MNDSPENSAPWDVNFPQFAALGRDIDVDVLIVGAGLTGITTAYLMAVEGVRVALIDRQRLVRGDSARTTAHLTYVTDERLHRLVSKFGKDGAAAFWKAGEVAIDTIQGICETTGAEAQFERVPGYLHAPIGSSAGEEVSGLLEDAELAAGFGLEATFLDSVPYAQLPGVRFENQAKFHPGRYLRCLLPVIERHGGMIFENTAFEQVLDDKVNVQANGRRVRCQYLVIATHNPLMGMQGVLTATLFQTKLALYTSYVLGARLPPDTLPEALFWDTNDPYEYLRVDTRGDHQFAIFGGGDVKTGQEVDTEQVYQKLQARLSRLLPSAKVERRWMGQVVETDDGMPFIGENEGREFIATGFCGNGFTLGTLAALMARDRFLKRDNPWFTLFATRRSPFHGGTWRYLKENADFPYYFIRDRLRRPPQDAVQDVASGEGALVRHNGRVVAAYRDESGVLTLLSTQCTHLKCLVHWNSADRTWDCPCHGSRFRPTGEVLSGPAEQPLQLLK